jgi:DnaJ-domain-containing protein 1
MGQILKRLINIAKAEISDTDISNSNNYINKDDEELKKIIEELNKKSDKYTYENSKTRQKEAGNRERQSQNIMNLDLAYKTLGIEVFASVDEIKSAYKNMIKDYHPDRVSHLGEELRSLAAQKTVEINAAYNFIKKNKNFV